MLQAGAFGGGYFRTIDSSTTKAKYPNGAWTELPADWLAGLDVSTQVASDVRNKVLHYMCVCVRAFVHPWAYVRMCVRACTCACFCSYMRARARVCVRMCKKIAVLLFKTRWH